MVEEEAHLVATEHEHVVLKDLPELGQELAEHRVGLVLRDIQHGRASWAEGDLGHAEVPAAVARHLRASKSCSAFLDPAAVAARTSVDMRSNGS